jgi:arylsulfatase A-like enzyme
MNFILIVSDTLRRDHLGCYGNSWIHTEHLDRFASRSLVFDRAYSASFPTVPNRRDIMTGRLTAAYTDWAPLTSQETVLAEVLGRHGYTTMMVCDCPHILENGYGFDRGFDGFEWIRGQESDRWRTSPETPAHACDPGKIRNPDWIQRRHRRNVADRRYERDTFVARTATAACEWLQDNYRQPFFLYVDTFDPHEPWDAPQWYVDRYDPGYTGQVVDYPRYDYCDYLTPDELRHCRALYAAEVTLVDRWVGRVLQQIEDLGLLDDTVVMLTTDHGFLLGEHGFIGKSLITAGAAEQPRRPGERTGGGLMMSYIPLYEEIVHIPLIVHRPGVNAGRTDALVQPPDLMPTILDLAGIPIPESVDGIPFGPVLRRESDDHRTFAVSAPYLANPTAAVTVVKDPWTAVLTPKRPVGEGGRDKAVDGVTKGTARRAVSADLLFDMAADPQQAADVSAEHPAVLKDLRSALVAELTRVGASEEVVRLWRE